MSMKFDLFEVSEKYFAIIASFERPKRNGNICERINQKFFLINALFASFIVGLSLSEDGIFQSGSSFVRNSFMSS